MLPRSPTQSDDIRSLIQDIRALDNSFDPPGTLVPGNDHHLPTVGQDDQLLDKSNRLSARRRSRSMGAQHNNEPRPFPAATGAVPNISLLHASVSRPPRKSSLVRMPDSIRQPRTESPSISRTSSASSLQLSTSRTLQPKRSMPELDHVWEDDGVLTPTQRGFNSTQQDENTHSRRRPRASSTASHERQPSNQRFSNLPASPAPSMALPSVPRPTNAHAIVDLTSPHRSSFGAEITALPSSYSSTALSLPYVKEDEVFPSRESVDIAHICRLTPPPEDDARTPTPGSSYESEDTLSLFPQPPPLNIPHHFAQSPIAAHYPSTSDSTPTATPTSTTSFQSLQLDHIKKPSRPTSSILKKQSSYYNPLPSPPITPRALSVISRSSSRGSFQMMSPEPVAPTLKIRNSSPHIASAKTHNAHRPTSSDSCSAYSASSERIDYDVRKQALPWSEVPTLVEADQPETEDEKRPPSAEPRPQAVQWGYAV
jgi:hypothetical protein